MRRWTSLALLLGALLATLATLGLIVLQLADDGGSLIAEAGRPSERRCQLTKLRLQARLGARRSRLRSALLREGPGLILVGASNDRRRAARASIAYALRHDEALPCCGMHEEWDLSKRHVRQALRNARGPYKAWLAPAAYHPFLSALVPSARGQVVVHVRDPVDAPARAWAPRPLGALLALTANASAATHATLQRRLPLSLSRQAMAVVGLAAPADACFATYFESQLDALASGRWFNAAST